MQKLSASLLGLLSFFVITFAQASGDFTPYWPKGIDGTDKFPENHRLMYESSHIKVVDVFIAAQEAEKPHTHLLNSFMFVDQPTKIVVRLVDEKDNELIVFEQTESQENPSRPQFMQMDAEPFHYVSNIDDKDYRAIRIEIKEEAQPLSKNKIEWDVSITAEERIENALWNLSIPSKSYPTIRTNGFVGILVGNSDSRLKVYKRNLEVLNPLKYSENRPPVWILDSNGEYIVENPSTKEEGIFLLTIAE